LKGGGLDWDASFQASPSRAKRPRHIPPHPSTCPNLDHSVFVTYYYPPPKSFLREHKKTRKGTLRMNAEKNPIKSSTKWLVGAGILSSTLAFAISLPSDPLVSRQWGIFRTNTDDAWAGRGVKSCDGITVAVLDTGVDTHHPDLRDNLDLYHARNVAEDNTDVQDQYGHGTLTAGVIGARGNNHLGISGVCQRVKILPVKVAAGESGSAFHSDIIEGAAYAAAAGARVINISFGGPGKTTAFDAPFYRLRNVALITVSAGNSGTNNDGRPYFPANANSRNVVSVAASTNTFLDALASFSNRGLVSVDLAAPGVDILSTELGGGYRKASGTSFSAPMVAGAAAMIMAKYPGISVDATKHRLLDRGQFRFVTLFLRVNSGRRLDVNNSLR